MYSIMNKCNSHRTLHKYWLIIDSIQLLFIITTIEPYPGSLCFSMCYKFTTLEMCSYCSTLVQDLWAIFGLFESINSTFGLGAVVRQFSLKKNTATIDDSEEVASFIRAYISNNQAQVSNFSFIKPVDYLKVLEIVFLARNYISGILLSFFFKMNYI